MDLNFLFDRHQYHLFWSQASLLADDRRRHRTVANSYAWRIADQGSPAAPTLID